MKNISCKKKILLLLGIIISIISSYAYAEDSAGCGLGSLIGITSGTSNCGPDISAQIEKQTSYLAVNLTSLQREVSQGIGETLNGFASVLGCHPPIYHFFAVHAQKKYEVIFTSNKPSVILVNVKNELKKNHFLNKSCYIGRI